MQMIVERATIGGRRHGGEMGGPQNSRLARRAQK
jgi:hypothetical protein